jgi:hypothetical protein
MSGAMAVIPETGTGTEVADAAVLHPHAREQARQAAARWLTRTGPH